jgi:hypothetical protein
MGDRYNKFSGSIDSYQGSEHLDRNDARMIRPILATSIMSGIRDETSPTFFFINDHYD